MSRAPERSRATRARVAIATALALGALPGCSQPAPRPNILFILVDDQAPNSTGFEGNPIVLTPQLDTLAREGTYFSRAYVPLPQCAPSRAALLTGRYPHEVGVMTNGEGTLDPSFPTFAALLAQADYRRGLIGKWHLGEPGRPQAGFDDTWITLDLEAKGHASYFDPPLWIGTQRVPQVGYLPEILTDHALEFIDRDDPRPFLLWLAYKTPHYPYVRPGGGARSYPPSEVPLPVSATDDLTTKPSSQARSSNHAWYLEAGSFGVRSDTARYYAMLSALDEQIGRLLQRLDERGLRETTLIIYMSDNGVMLGEHQMVAKGPVFYDELVRTPLIFRWPGVVPAGERRSALVSSLDVLPTFAALAGVTPPTGLPGTNIWPLVLGETGPVRDEIFFEFSEKAITGEDVPMLGVATQRHKYVRYLANGEEELYDLDLDPREMNNLAGSDVHQPELEQLRARVDRFQKSIANPFWP